MSRILIAWEMGANYGHLAQLAAVAGPLCDAGHQLLFAVRDLTIAAEILGPRGFEFVQAPVFQRRRRAPAPPASHAEILALEGYADHATASGLVGGWVTLAATYRAEAIVADSSPGALVAGRILELPRAQIGTGFAIPPLVSPMPCIRPWERIPEARLARAEHHLEGLLNRVARSYHGREIGNLADLYRTEARVLTTFPELDPFGPRPGERYVGPIFEHESGEPAAWPEGGLPRIFAYLRGDVPGAGNILQALKSAAAVTLCVAPGLRPTVVSELTSDRLRVATRPLQLKRLLRGADLALLYGGHGLMCAALTAGVPLLVAPHTVEQYLHAKRADAAGVAMVVEGDRSVEAVAAQIGQVLGNAGLKARAREFADRHAGFDPALAAAEAAEIIGGIARGRATAY